MPAILRIIAEDGSVSDLDLVEGRVLTVDAAGRVTAVPVASFEALHARLSQVETELNRLRDAEPAGAPHLRDMGATLLDKARARLLEAQADKLEREVAAEFAYAPDGDRPFPADRWSVISDIVPGTIIACARDLQGREIRVETSPDRARWLAEHLLAAARQIEAGGA